MAQVFHLVGVQGSGKTMLAVLMSQGFAAIKGSVCMLQFDIGCVVRFDPVQGDFMEPGDIEEDPAQADVLFVEHMPDSFAGGKPGDTVIRMERVPEVIDTTQLPAP